MRQLAFQAYYVDPKSSTFANAYQSAVKAGYSVAYAKQITHQSPKVLSEAVTMHQAMIEKAERNLEDMLTLDESEPVMTAFGPMKNKATGQPIMRRNTKIMAIKADLSKFVLERLDRKHFSTKEALSGDGQVEPRPILMQFNVHRNDEEGNSKHRVAP